VSLQLRIDHHRQRGQKIFDDEGIVAVAALTVSMPLLANR